MICRFNNGLNDVSVYCISNTWKDLAKLNPHKYAGIKNYPAGELVDRNSLKTFAELQQSLLAYCAHTQTFPGTSS